MSRLFDKNVNISFIQSFETAKEFLSDKVKDDLFRALSESDNEVLKLRINNLEELLEILKIFPNNLSYKLFNRVLNDNELFIHFIRDNSTLSNLWFGASMQTGGWVSRLGLIPKCAVPLWAREYLFDIESFLYTQSEDDVILKCEDYSSEPKGYLFTLGKSVAETIRQVLSAEEKDFISAFEKKQQDVLIRTLEKAITNDSLLERIFVFFDNAGQPFSLETLFKLIPNDLAYKLIQSIVQNDRLNASVDLMSLSNLSSVNNLKRAIEKDENIDFDEIKNEIRDRIKNSSLSYSSLNLFLHILIEKDKKISSASPIKNILSHLINFLKENRVPSLRFTVSFFLQQANEKVKIKGKTHDETSARKEMIEQALVDNISLDYEEIVTDINNNNNTLNIIQRELKNQIAFEKMLQRLKTEPDLVRPLFKKPQFASQFHGEQLCAFALSDIEIANGILDAIAEKFNSDEIGLKEISDVIRAYPSIAYPILQHLNLGGLQLLSIANIHPEAANAILKTPKQFNVLAKHRGANGALVILAIKHYETAKVILNNPKLSDLLTDENLIKIATHNPNIINDILGNKKIMSRISEETEVVLGAAYSLLTNQQDSESNMQSSNCNAR